jgi:hypothetical protein
MNRPNRVGFIEIKLETVPFRSVSRFSPAAELDIEDDDPSSVSG